MRPIDNRVDKYDKKWVVNDKQNAVMNGNKIGSLGGINIIFMVIKLLFWAIAIRPYSIPTVYYRLQAIVRKNIVISS